MSSMHAHTHPINGVGPSVTNLSAYLPFIIAGNVRLKHRYPAIPLVDAWIRNSFIRRTVGAPPCVGSAGDLVLGELHCVPNRATTILDHTGIVHVLPASPHPRPVRVLAPLGTRDSSIHCNGGLYDPVTGAPASSIAVAAGQSLAWLGEPSGIVGHLLADAPKRVLAVEDDAVAVNGSQAAPATQVSFIPHACTFVVIGVVYDASSGQPLHIRSLSPLPPPAPPARHLPRIILVGSTCSSAGKTSLACSVILSLHAARHAMDRPKIAFLKLTGSGSLRDTFEVSSLKTPDSAPAVIRAYDHVDGGLVSTYAVSTSAEKFKGCVAELVALAAAPINGVPIDYIVCELGSDLIWAHNPLLLNLPIITSNLLGLFLLASDALSILGACNYLHGTLSLSPEKLLLVNSHLYSYSGMLGRIRGSQVKLYQHAEQDIKEGLVLLEKSWEREEERRAEEFLRREEERKRELMAQAAAAQQQQNLNGTNPPTTGSSSAPSSHGSTPSPSSASSSSSSGPRYSLSITLLEFPSSLTAAPGRLPSAVCEQVVQWVVASPSTTASAGEAGWRQQLKQQGELEIDEVDIGTVIASVTKDPKLQQALNFQFLIRKRDRLRAKEAAEEAAGTAAAATATPSSSSSTSTSSGSHLLLLGDYSSSPYAFPPSPTPAPDIAGALLEFDSCLGWLRRKTVPARVNEEVFWQTYFDAIYQRMQAYLQARIVRERRR